MDNYRFITLSLNQNFGVTAKILIILENLSNGQHKIFFD